ncbi:MAG: PfkB family carbohydrate kinase [Cyanobacteria bacterium J06636_16]
MKTGVFVGLITLDCIYQTTKALEPNEKQVAEAMLLAAGGPATNAAVAFRALGNRAIVVGALGCHPLSTVVRARPAAEPGQLVDLMPTATTPPPFSSIVVNTITGDRAVISRNAADRPIPQAPPPPNLLDQTDCVLIDGHQMALGKYLAQQAQRSNIPVVIDAGSWKPGFEDVLPLATAVIASAAFRPPGFEAEQGAIAYLQSLGIPDIAVTRGARPILHQTSSHIGELTVPTIKPVDTLGAGDIFHGAFCHGYTHESDFLEALTLAAQVASVSCQSFGTRQWVYSLSQPRQGKG